MPKLVMFSSDKPDRGKGKFSNAAIFAFDRLVADIQGIVKIDPYTDPIAMKELVASWAIVHGLADLIISGRTERPMGFSQMTSAEQDAALAGIFLSATKYKTEF